MKTILYFSVDLLIVAVYGSLVVSTLAIMF